MKRKLFCLLTLLLTVCSGAWAEETTILSLDATVSGKITIAPEEPTKGDYFTFLSVSQGNGNSMYGMRFIEAISAEKYIKVTLPTGYSLKTGDEIKVTHYQAGTSSPNNAYGTVISSTTSTDAGDIHTYGIPTSQAKTAAEITYTVTASDEFNGTNTFYVRGFSPSSSKSSFVQKIKVVRDISDTKVATPTYTLGAWDAVNEKYAVTLDCETASATIKYSTNNKVSYSDYSTALALAPGTTLDAYAVKAEMENSDNMEQYTVPAAPTYYTITYAKAGDVDGILPPAAENIVSGSSINVPKNYTMYKEGYTFKGWDADGNGTVDYAGGAAYTVTANATLTAVFAENTVGLNDRTAATTIKWGSWNQSLGVPAIHFEGASGFVVAQATVAGETIDVKLTINATSGKFKNQPSNDWTQVGPGTVFTIPAAEGATITYKQYDNGATTTPEATATGDTYELTAAGTPSSLYYEYIQVVLPKPAGVKAEAPVYKLRDGGANVTEISANNYMFATASGTTKFRVKAQPYTYVRYTVGENEMPAAPTLTSGTEIKNQTGDAEKESSNIECSTHTKTYYVRAIAWDAAKTPESASDEVVLVVAANQVTVTIASACTYDGKFYATFSNDKAFVVPADLTVSAVGISDKKLVVTNYTTDDVVKANTGVMLSSETAGNKTITLSADTGIEKSGNYLKASSVAMTGENLFYRLTMHNPDTENKIGFWWGAEDGAAFYIAANKAYLAVPTGEALARGLWFDEGETTSLNEVRGLKSDVRGEYFNLNGQRVAQPTKGLYIVNGRKVVIK